MQNREKILEKEIINITEQAIEAIIEASSNKAEKNGKTENAVNLISLLADKLSILLNGQNAYLAESLQQIIQQKLPDQRILTQMPDFSNQLQMLILEGIKRFETNHQASQVSYIQDESNQEELNSENTADPDIKNELSEEEQDKREEVREEYPVEAVNYDQNLNENLTDKENEDKIEVFLLKNYPNLTFHKNYKFHGIKLDYYFPDLNLALEREEDNFKHKSGVWKEYHLRKAGIKLVKVNPDVSQDYRRFNKFIKKII